MITPAAFQVPPRGLVASASVSGVPPVRLIRFSLPSAKNPSDRPSGDQKGGLPLMVVFPAPGSAAVPARARAAGESSERIHNPTLPVSSGAQNATWRPSGEMAGAG